MRWHYIRLFILIGVLAAAAVFLIAVIYYPKLGTGLTRLSELGVFSI